MKINQNMLVRVSGKSENPTKINIKAGEFNMVIDEPEFLGGTNQGPSPVQALLMSLVGCLNITGHFVARQYDLKLNGMEIEIEGELNPSKFMGISQDDRAGFKEINVKIYPDFEDVTIEEIKNWLEETESRCPVTDNIRLKTNIRVELPELIEK